MDFLENLVTSFYSRILFPMTIIVSISQSIFSQSLLYPEIPPDNISDLNFITDEQVIFINEGGSIYKSYDGGITWKLKKHLQGYSLNNLRFVNEKTGFAIAESPQELPYLGLIYTLDAGETWKTQPVSVTDAVAFLPLTESIVLKSTNDGRIHRLDNFFNEWKTTYKTPSFSYKDPEFGTLYKPYGFIQKIQKLPSGEIIAMGLNSQAKRYQVLKDSLTFFIRSRDSGLSWDTLWAGFNYFIADFSMSDNKNGWMCLDSLLFRTSDGGRSWKRQDNSLVSNHLLTHIFAADSQYIFAMNSVGITERRGILRTTDAGSSWDFAPLNLSYGNNFMFRNRQKGIIFGRELYKTENSSASWQNTATRISDDIKDLDFVNVNEGFALGGYGIYKTSDGGKSWTIKFRLKNYYGDPGQIKMLSDSSGWYVNGTEGRIYRTDDAGENWKEIKLSEKAQRYRGIEFFNNKLGIINTVSEENIPGLGFFYAKYHLITTDGGQNWINVKIDSSSKAFYFDKMQFVTPANLWAINQYGLWQSKDTARTWTKMFGGEYFIGGYSFCFYDSTYGIVTGSYNEAYLTTDGGRNWKEFTKPIGNHPTDCKILGPNIWGDFRVLESGSDGKLIEYDFNRSGKITRDHVLTTFTRNVLNKIEVVNKDSFPYVWIAGYGFIVLNRQFEKIFTAVDFSVSHVEDFSLSQNYPNPFNPTTTINYSIPIESSVELKVYDMLGCEVSTLVNEQQSAGEYNVKFNGSSLPSGMYIYTIQAGQFRESKKLLLLK